MTLLLNRQLVSRATLCLVSGLPHIVKDYPKMRNLPKIFLRSFENVGPNFFKHPIPKPQPLNLESQFYMLTPQGRTINNRSPHPYPRDKRWGPKSKIFYMHSFYISVFLTEQTGVFILCQV